MRPLIAAILVGLALFIGACLGGLEPEVGDLLQPPCENVDDQPATDVSFESDLLVGAFAGPPGNCSACHDPQGEQNLGYTIGGLDLTSYAGLSAGGVNSGGDIVVPGSPCQSVLYQKLGPSPPFGGRMPFSGPPFLGDAVVRLVADWIAEGADEN